MRKQWPDHVRPRRLGPQACAIAEPAIDVEVSEEDDNGVGFEGEGIGREAVWGEGVEEFGGIDEGSDVWASFVMESMAR